MLSYKHGYHAGNHADVMKHIVLIYLYNLSKKHHKSISYIDTHSGSGKYDYKHDYMNKNKEYNLGIRKLDNYDGNNRLILNYLRILKKINFNKNYFYFGSPVIIANISDKNDRLNFCELHKNEYKNLKKNLNKFTNAKIYNEDGFKFIKKIKDKKKDYFIFIDPSYELKSDYEEIETLLDNYEKNLIKQQVMIWYPVINLEEKDLFIEKIKKKGINNLLNIELPIYKYNEDLGMKGSGLILINFKKSIFKNLKILIKELHTILKNTDSNKPKIKYL